MVRKYDLDERLINFAAACIGVSKFCQSPLQEIILRRNLSDLRRRPLSTMVKHRLQRAATIFYTK